MKAFSLGLASHRGPLAARMAVAYVAAFAVGCGTPCEEAAQICADEGRSSAASPSTPQATCEGAVEAQAICITDAESCAPDVVEACLAQSGVDEDGAEGS